MNKSPSSKTSEYRPRNVIPASIYRSKSQPKFVLKNQSPFILYTKKKEVTHASKTVHLKVYLTH